MTVKGNTGHAVQTDARDLIMALIEAAKTGRGVLASAVPVRAGMARQSAARYLRECGLPVYAARAGSRSVWYLMHSTDKAGFRNTWRKRIIEDAYSEVCRAHMAMVNHPFAQSEARELSNMAVVLGNWLGRSTTGILADLAPRAVPVDIQVMLDDLDRSLNGAP